MCTYHETGSNDMELRDYQISAVKQALAHVASGRRPLIVAPTGSGKSVIASAIATALGKFEATTVLAHTSEVQRMWRTRYGLTAMHPISLLNRMDAGDVLPANTAPLLLVDEAHHYAASRFSLAVSRWSGPVVGFTATPIRSESWQSLSSTFDTMVVATDAATVRSEGHLAPMVVLDRHFEAVDALETRAQGSRTSLTDSTYLDHDSVVAATQGLLSRTGGLSTLVFASSRLQCDRLSSGIDGAAPYHAGMSSTDRQTVLQAFVAGSLQCLVTVNAIAEGVDIPRIKNIVLARRMHSRTAYLQACGRATRPWRDETATVLDLSGTVALHGLPYDPTMWSLKTKSSVACPFCGAPNFAGVCRVCGETAMNARPQDGTTATVGHFCPVCLAIMAPRQKSCLRCRNVEIEVNVMEVVVGGARFAWNGGAWVSRMLDYTIHINATSLRIDFSDDLDLDEIPKGLRRKGNTFTSLPAAFSTMGWTR